MTKEKKDTFVFNRSAIPTTSGCYMFFDIQNELLYVGKAKNIRHRVASYFQKNNSKKTEIMTKKIAKIETQSVNSEIESLILENNLIKKHRPRFNVLLRDDKNFTYLRLTKEEKPKLEVTRRIFRDGSTYFGPKTSTKDFREVIRFCQKYFFVEMTKASQNYYPHQILGREISPEEYQKNITHMKQFLRGKTSDIIKELSEKMKVFAKERKFEAAAKMRDTIQSIKKITQKQIVELGEMIDQDFVHYVRGDGEAYFVRFVFKQGKLSDQTQVTLRADNFITDKEVLTSFLLQFYPQVDELPENIYIPHEIDDTTNIIDFIAKQSDLKNTFHIIIPQKGDKKKVIEMTHQSAKIFAKKKHVEKVSTSEDITKHLIPLAKLLKIKSTLTRIECYDISHFSGDQTVGSMVVLEEGVPKPSDYRRFKIKTLKKGEVDDYASLMEVIERRTTNWTQTKKSDNSFKRIPDLIIIDGGKGQLSSVMKIFAKNFDEKLQKKLKFYPKKQVVALAKEEETIFFADDKKPLNLKDGSPELRLMQNVRDEAHRFALSFNRSLRKKSATKSILDEMDGIGSATKKNLLQTFGSIAGIRSTSDQELLKIVNKKQLESLRKQL